MNALNRLPRPAFVGLLAALVLVAAGLTYAVFGVGDVSSQGSKPNAPTGLNVNAKGDKEADLRWTAPSASSCATTEYYVRIQTASGGVEDEVAYTTGTRYVATFLTASTSYVADVWAYGSSCRAYSTTPATVTFTTNADDSGSDPTAPAGQPKAAPNRPGAVSMTKSGTSSTINWSAPDADAARCPHTDYSWRVENRTTYKDSDDTDGFTTGTSTTVTGLTTGHRYLFSVWSYSTHPCDVHSGGSELRWTQ